MQFMLNEMCLVGLTKRGGKALAFAARAALGAGLLVAVAGLLSPATLRAQTTIYWDTNGKTPGAGSGTTAAGTWDQSTTANWSTSSLGTNAGTTWNTAIVASPTGTGIADFSAGSNATGAFTVTVNGTVTGVGGITFEEGAVTLGGTGTLTLNNTGTINVTAPTGTISAILGGAVGMTKTGTGTLVISSANTYSGATNINAGTLQLGASNLLPNATALTVASGATLDLNGFQDTVGSLAGAGNVTLGAFGSSLQVGGDKSSTNFSGVISESGFLQKTGSGTLTLSGVNTYTGATNINAGTVQLGAANAISSSSAVNVASGATFSLNSKSDTIGSLAGAGSVTLGTATLTAGADDTSTAFSGVISGTGSLAKTGAGNMTLSGTNTYGGVTTISGGTVSVSTDSNLGAAPGSASANELTLNGGTLQTTAIMTLNSNRGIALGASGGTLDVNPATTLSYGGIIAGSGALTKADTGTLLLSGVNTYTGATNINAGTLQLGATNAISSSSAVNVASGAIFNLNSKADAIGSLAGAGNVTLGTATLTAGANGTSTNFSGVVSGTGGLTKSGSGALALSGANTYTGATNVNAGKLQLGAASALSSSTVVAIASGATFDLNTYSQQIAGLSGSGIVTLGGGTLGVANGNNTTFSGSFAANDTGTLIVGGTGSLTFGSNMNLSNGNLTLFGGTLFLGGHTSTFGTLDVTGNSILDFGTSGSSVLNLTSLVINTGITLTIKNWADSVDYFYSLTNPGTGSLGRIVFTGFTGPDTKWLSYNNQITPVPEPATYGAILMLLGLSVGAWLRWRRQEPVLVLVKK